MTANDAATPSSSQPSRARSRRWLSARYLLVVAIAVMALIGFSLTLSQASSYRAYVVPSTSMMPTIAPGDRVAVDESRSSTPQRGEIWVFRMPPGAAPGGAIGIKRVVGLPGDSIEAGSGRILINGRPIKESYLVLPFTYMMPRQTLKPDEFFLLGDNRDKSNDSHVFGPVPRRNLIGRARGRVWPLGRVGGF